VNNIKSATI